MARQFSIQLVFKHGTVTYVCGGVLSASAYNTSAIGTYDGDCWYFRLQVFQTADYNTIGPTITQWGGGGLSVKYGVKHSSCG